MNVFVIAGRLIREITSDKRTIALLLVAPVLIISLLYLALNARIETVHIGLDPESGFSLDADGIDAIEAAPDKLASLLEDRSIDAYITREDGELRVFVNGTDPSVDKAVATALQLAANEALREGLARLPFPVSLPHFTFTQIYGKESPNTFDHIAPFMMGYIVFFLIFLLAGIAFLRERISGTMSRMMATAVHRWQIVAGYILGFGFFAFLQTVIIQTYMIHVLGIPNRGGFLLILLINCVIAGSSLTLGILLSAFARNEFQLFQFIPIVIIPQTLFAGLFSLRDAHPAILLLSRFFPLKYAADALSKVVLEGKGIDVVWQDLVVLLGFMAGFLLLNIRVLRKYRNA